jgi:hypothetical protein
MKQNLKEEIERNIELMNVKLNEDILDKISSLAKSAYDKLVDTIDNFFDDEDDDVKKDTNVDSKESGIENKVNSVDSEVKKGSSKNFSQSSDIPNDFNGMTELVIDVFEGGYYNPDWHRKSAMGDSGETMFGIDRKHGSYLERTPEGSEFWKLVDDNKAEFDKSDGKLKTWGHGYDGGNLKNRLLKLVSKMMQRAFEKNMDNNFDSETKKIILSDKGLKFNFYYATWNGSGYFRDFASKIKTAIKNGVTSPMELREIAIDARRKSKVGRSAGKMASLLDV